MQSKDSGWKTLLTNLIKRKLKNEGTLWVSINRWTPHTPACTKRGLRIFRGQGVLATLSGKLETDHVLLVFFLGHLFFFYRRRKKVYSDGTVVLDLWDAAGQTAMADSCAWDVLNDQAISTALFSVTEEPLLISFSLTLRELVPNTMRSYNILSGFLKSRFWAIKDQRCVDLWWIPETRLRQKHA